MPLQDLTLDIYVHFLEARALTISASGRPAVTCVLRCSKFPQLGAKVHGFPRASIRRRIPVSCMSDGGFPMGALRADGHESDSFLPLTLELFG